MNGLILTVAGPEWLATLNTVTAAADSSLIIAAHDPAEAVIMLASNPSAYIGVVVEEPIAGPWFDTLVDLTLGDTDRPIPLLMLGRPSPQNRLNGTPTLPAEIDVPGLHEALRRAAINAAQHVAPPLPDVFSNADSIRIRYQPIIRLADMRPTSVEILARVQTETGPLVGPHAIIAAMVNGDFAMSVSRFIVSRALREHNECNFNQLPVNFSFNLPLDAMLHHDLLTTLTSMQTSENISANSLRIELTETKPVTNLSSIRKAVESLDDAGYKIALDDITPFTANLDALLDLPFRAVKLDRSVTIGALSRHPGTAQRNRNFIQKITAHANQKRAVIAEGIETEPTRQLMQNLGASHGQGYLFARPLPAGALRPWLTHWQTMPEGK